jgi:dihydrofolate reductase
LPAFFHPPKKKNNFFTTAVFVCRTFHASTSNPLYLHFIILSMHISLIVAASENNTIGKNNQLLWKLPNDMKFFKATTWALPLIMGRKTFESIGSKPLPGRMNIIITRQSEWSAPGIVSAASVEDAIARALTANTHEIFIAGGGEIYQQALPLAHRVYLTRVHTQIEGDTFFPSLDPAAWRPVSARDFKADEKHAFDYSFQLFERY